MAVSAIVVSGAGRTFIAGRDIRELERAAWGEAPGGPDAHLLLEQMEACSTPIASHCAWRGA